MQYNASNNAYLWLVEVYERKRQFGFKKRLVRCTKRDRVFTSKIEAMTYIVNVRSNPEYDAKLVKWFGQ